MFVYVLPLACFYLFIYLFFCSEFLGPQLRVDGIDLVAGNYLPRRALIDGVMNFLRVSNAIVLASPPATGKSSLMQLLEVECRTLNLPVVKISFAHNPDPMAAFASIVGFDLQSRQWDPSLSPPPLTVILLDEAQRVYDVEGFWSALFKGGSLPFKFVIAAVYHLGSHTPSPVDFAAFPHFDRRHFMITDDEAKEWYHMAATLVKAEYLNRMTSVRDNIVRMANGHIGVISAAIWQIVANFREFDTECAIQKFVQGSMVSCLGRCFVKPSQDVAGQLFHAISHRFIRGSGPITDEVKALQRAGIFDESGNFVSLAARTFFFNMVFPNRASRLQVDNVADLVIEAVKHWSAKLVLDASRNRNLPKESPCHHMLEYTLAMLIPVTHTIQPEATPPRPGFSSPSCIQCTVSFFLIWRCLQRI
jgi:hypothetical protein